MDSMNHFLNSHSVPVFFIFLAVFLGFLGVFILVLVRLTKRYDLPESAFKILCLLAVAASLFLTSLVTSSLGEGSDLGKIRRLFAVPGPDGPRLTLWLTRRYGKRVGADWNQNLATFDLATGERLGLVKLVDRHGDDEYAIHRISQTRAWGLRESKKVQFLDLVSPAVLSSGKLSDVPKDDLRTPDLPPDPWRFDPLKDSMGKHARRQGAESSPHPVILLDPEFIPGLDTGAVSPEKTWVRHRSALLGDSDPLISYVDEGGAELMRLALMDFVDDRNAEATHTLTLNEEVLVFVSRGDSLIALRTRRDTGEFLGVIRYF